MFDFRREYDDYRLLDAPARPLLNLDRVFRFSFLHAVYGPNELGSTNIYLSGVTPEGHSVMIGVIGFRPYFLIRRPLCWTDDDCTRFCESLDFRIKEMDRLRDDDDPGNKRRRTSRDTNVESDQHQPKPWYRSKLESRMLHNSPRWVLGWSAERGVSFEGYSPPEVCDDFLRIGVVYPNMVRMCREALEAEFECRDIPGWLSNVPRPNVGGGGWRVDIFEANVEFVMRFIVDKQLDTSEWCEIRPGDFSGQGYRRRFTTDYELWCGPDAIRTVSESTPGPNPGVLLRDTTPNVKILAFDIEALAVGHFPRADEGDPVIQIGIVLYRLSDPARRRRFLLTLVPDHDHAVDPLVMFPDAAVLKFVSEAELLLKFRHIVIGTDPDIIIGYNHIGFDLRYMRDRARALGLWDFNRLDRMPLDGHTMRLTTRVVRGQTTCTCDIGGRAVIDVLRYFSSPGAGMGSRSKKLDCVAAHVLGLAKLTMNYNHIPRLWGTAAGRRMLGDYCLWDAELCVLLGCERKFIEEYILMSHALHVTMQIIHDRGSQQPIFAVVLWYIRHCSVKDDCRMLFVATKLLDELIKYAGGVVQDPRKGFYRNAVILLDFMSLYPMTIMEKNLCLSTFITRRVASEYGLVEGPDYWSRPLVRGATATNDRPTFDPDTDEPILDRNMSPDAPCFVTPSRFAGIIPRIEQELFQKRQEMKRQLADAKRQLASTVAEYGDSSAEARVVEALVVLRNFRQLAMKLVMNKIYGVVAALTSPMRHLPVAETITWRGRLLINWMAHLAEVRYTPAAGYPCKVELVYGDTDSILVEVPGLSLEDAMALGEQMSRDLSAVVPAPHKLEHECTLCPLLMVSRKMYVGMEYQPGASGPPTLKVRGLANVRGGTCNFLRETMDEVISLLIRHIDPPRAIQYARDRVGALLAGDVPIKDLVVRAGLKKPIDEYGKIKADGQLGGVPVHAVYAKRLRAENPNDPPRPGDTLSYVFCTVGDSARKGDHAVHPMKALMRRYPADLGSYVKLVEKPLLGLLEPLFDNRQAAHSSIFTGKHVTRRSASALRTDSPMARFISPGAAAAPVPLCDDCRALVRPVVERARKRQSTEHNHVGTAMGKFVTRTVVCPPFDVELCPRCSIYADIIRGIVESRGGWSRSDALLRQLENRQSRRCDIEGCNSSIPCDARPPVCTRCLSKDSDTGPNAVEKRKLGHAASLELANVEVQRTMDTCGKCAVNYTIEEIESCMSEGCANWFDRAAARHRLQDMTEQVEMYYTN